MEEVRGKSEEEKWKSEEVLQEGAIKVRVSAIKNVVTVGRGCYTFN